MKKIFAFILSLTLLGSMTAMADDSNRQTELKVTIEESYTIEIPTTLDIPFNSTSTNLPIKVTSLRLLSTGTNADYVRKLCVNIPNYNAVLTSANGDKITYSIGGSERSPEKEIRFTDTGTKNFTIDITQEKWDAAPAGTYTGTLTFKVVIAYCSK